MVNFDIHLHKGPPTHLSRCSNILSCSISFLLGISQTMTKRAEFRLPNFFILPMHYIRALMEEKIKELHLLFVPNQSSDQPRMISAPSIPLNSSPCLILLPASPAPQPQPVPLHRLMLVWLGHPTTRSTKSIMATLTLFDTAKVGHLEGQTPVNFFLKSKLPETVLARVWDLADISHNGKLSRDEFVVAMHS